MHRFPQVWTRAVVGALASAALLGSLVGCAPEPDAGWVPPEAALAFGVRLADAGQDPFAPLTGAASEADDGTAAGASGAAAGASAAAVLDGAELGLIEGRVRNDQLPLAARFVYVPGVPEFNERVNTMLREAISATGVAYTPQAYPAGSGLGDRGCVSGSTQWPAADVLSRAETGPVGGSGTAITCDIDSAAGSALAITTRVVTGTSAAVTGDVRQRWIIDVSAGSVADGANLWTDAAPAELWTRAVEVLRDAAGGLSRAAIGAPGEEQLALARAALAGAVPAESGGMRVVLPSGIAAPELAGLGIAETEREIALEIDAETARGWVAAAVEVLLAAEGDDGDPLPFVGVSAPRTSVAIDCALIPCVALTYDDGPSAFTPELLDTLASRNATATFYVLGGRAAQLPDTVRRTAAEGHELGSHTNTHQDLTMVSLDAARAQVVGAADTIRTITGAPVATFRPPYGAINQAVIDAVGMPAVLWSVDTNDWRRPGQEALVDRAVNGVNPGGIVLFHDTHADTVNAAGAVIDGLRDRGMEPVTVSTLFGGAVPQGRVSSR